jgi:arylsulfatase A-like enzyme
MISSNQKKNLRNIGGLIAMKDNVLFILTDQWRADSLSCHGHSVVKTPHIDILAKNSIDYRNSFTVCPLCTPARGCLMTGLLPHKSGIVDNCHVGASKQSFLPNTAYTWLDEFVANGYRTAYYGKWHLGNLWDSKKHGVDFDICSQEVKPNFKPANPASERGEIRKGFHTLYQDKVLEDENYNPPFYKKIDSIEERVEYKVKEKALNFLNNLDDEDSPWCLTASFVSPHFPLSLPEPYFSMYNPESIELSDSINDRFLNKPWFQNRHWWPSMITDGFSKLEWQKTMSAYFGMVSMTDALIGEIIEKAKLVSGGRKTRVIFTADHGEMLGAHSRFDKGAYFYDDVMRTPLVVCPDLNGTQNQIISEEFVSTADIAKTMFNLASNKSGKNIVTQKEMNNEKIVYGQYHKYNGHSFEVRCIRTDKYKYSYIPQDIDELYDLEKDPNELTNVSDWVEYQDIKSKLKSTLLEHIELEKDYLLDLKQLPQAGCISKPDYPVVKVNYEK